MQIYLAREGDTFYSECEKVLDLCQKVLKKYKITLSLYTPRSQEEKAKNEKQFYQVEFNYHNYCFKHLTRPTEQRVKESVPFYRKCVEYEFAETGKVGMLGFQQFVPYLEPLLGIPKKEITAKRFAKLSDNRLVEAIQLHILTDQVLMSDQVNPGLAEDIQRENARFSLNSCSGCHSTERFMKEYKGCARCNKVFYCSKGCQKKNWKSHKKNCNK